MIKITGRQCSFFFSTFFYYISAMSHEHGPGCNHGPEEGGTTTIQVNDANKAPELFKKIAGFLKDEKKSGLKPRQGVLNGKRFEYFKGKK